MSYAFASAENLYISATDTPDLTKVTDMSNMFRSAINVSGNFSGRDTSNVTDLSRIFRGATNFNGQL
jgi:hypothetical protein